MIYNIINKENDAEILIIHGEEKSHG
jgi:hypothetical protein